MQDKNDIYFNNMLMTLVFVLFTLFCLSSCAHKLLKQAPPLGKAETFYVFEDEYPFISHNRCKKRKGKDRKCTRTYYNINEMWKMFYPGFIIIKKDKVFK